MSFLPRALTLDLDDTLWAIEPVLLQAEQALHAWLLQSCPRVAERYPVVEMRRLRARIADEHPQLAHDYSAQRRLSLRAALRECGEDERHAEAAFEVFLAARNRVELYPEVTCALQRISALLPIAALTNGNADLRRIGLERYFAFSLGAREHGCAKPDAGIFLAACERLGCAPHEVLHVGDDPALDVLGARRAGLRCGWLNRNGSAWELDEAPDLHLRDLEHLADWIEARSAVPERQASVGRERLKHG